MRIPWEMLPVQAPPKPGPEPILVPPTRPSALAESEPRRQAVPLALVAVLALLLGLVVHFSLQSARVRCLVDHVAQARALVAEGKYEAAHDRLDALEELREAPAMRRLPDEDRERIDRDAAQVRADALAGPAAELIERGAYENALRELKRLRGDWNGSLDQGSHLSERLKLRIDRIERDAHEEIVADQIAAGRLADALTRVERLDALRERLPRAAKTVARLGAVIRAAQVRRLFAEAAAQSEEKEFTKAVGSLRSARDSIEAYEAIPPWITTELNARADDLARSVTDAMIDHAHVRIGLGHHQDALDLLSPLHGEGKSLFGGQDAATTSLAQRAGDVERAAHEGILNRLVSEGKLDKALAYTQRLDELAARLFVASVAAERVDAAKRAAADARSAVRTAQVEALFAEAEAHAEGERFVQAMALVRRARVRIDAYKALQPDARRALSERAAKRGRRIGARHVANLLAQAAAESKSGRPEAALVTIREARRRIGGYREFSDEQRRASLAAAARSARTYARQHVDHLLRPMAKHLGRHRYNEAFAAVAKARGRIAAYADLTAQDKRELTAKADTARQGVARHDAAFRMGRLRDKDVDASGFKRFVEDVERFLEEMDAYKELHDRDRQRFLRDARALKVRVSVKHAEALLEDAGVRYEEGGLERAGTLADGAHGALAGLSGGEAQRLRASAETYRKARDIWNRARSAFDGMGMKFGGVRTGLNKLLASPGAQGPRAGPLRRAIERLLRRVPTMDDYLLDMKDAAAAFGEEVKGSPKTVRLPRTGIRVTIQPPNPSQQRQRVVTTGGQSFTVIARALKGRPALTVATVVELSGVLSRVREGSDLPNVTEPWRLYPFSPRLATWNRTPSGPLFIMDGRPHTIRSEADREDVARRLTAFRGAAETLAQAIENDPGSPADVRRVLAVVVRAAYGKAKHYDYLRPQFVQRILEEGYLESQLPGIAERLGEQMRAYKTAYRGFARLEPSLSFSETGRGSARAVSYLSSPSARDLWRLPGSPRATFVVPLPVRGHTSLKLFNEFATASEGWPAGELPVRVRVMHPILGELARYDGATDTFTADAKRWAQAISLDEHIAMKPHMRGGDWRMPPHVPVLDERGAIKRLVLATGRLEMPRFRGEPAERRRQHEQFVDRVSKVLATPGALNLFFEYFLEYTLDSPIGGKPDLLGSSKHNGDIHQDLHQFLDRQLSGRIVADCDDLAEFYQHVTRRQGKISYVLGVPGHATCGWVQKVKGAPGQTGGYRMHFLDTGPPRRFRGDRLDSVIESGLRSYDFNNTLNFNKDSVEFLFRFAGEPTRTRYYLGTRMFTNDRYGKLLHDVQGMWHFHTYLRGIEVMKKVLEADDSYPADCFELGGLYRTVRQLNKAIEWRKKGVSHLPADDRISILSSDLSLSTLHRWNDQKKEALAVLDRVAREVKQLEKDPKKSLRYQRIRALAAMNYTFYDKPLKAWNVVRGDILRLMKAKELGYGTIGPVAGVYRQIMDKKRDEKKTLTAEESKALAEVEDLLERYFEKMHFESEDDFGQTLSKYGILAAYFAGKYGRDRFVEELLRDGPYPEKERNHRKRPGSQDTIDEDWKWIRLSLGAYAGEIGRLIDPEEEAETNDPDKAVRLIAAARRAMDHARKFGSLSRTEDSLLSLRLMGACIRKDNKEVEAIFKAAREKDWQPLYKQLASTLGGSARFVDPATFRAQLEIFRTHVPTKPQYFQVAYDAYRAEAYEHARIAARVAAAQYPEDEVFQRERDYLIKLATEKQAEAEKKKKAKEKKEQEAEPQKEKEEAPAGESAAPASKPANPDADKNKPKPKKNRRRPVP